MIYCSDCRKAGLKIEFARGKTSPTEGMEEGIPQKACRVD